MELTRNDKLSSLLRRGIKYGDEKFNSKSVFDTDQALLQFISILANTEHHPNRKLESRLIFLPCSNTLAYSAQFVNYNGEKFYK